MGFFGEFVEDAKHDRNTQLLIVLSILLGPVIAIIIAVLAGWTGQKGFGIIALRAITVWALLVVVIIILALIYLGIFGPPAIKTCQFPGSEISCTQSKLTADVFNGATLSLEIQNGAPRIIYVLGYACSASTITPSIDKGAGMQVPSGQKLLIPASGVGDGSAEVCIGEDGRPLAIPPGQPYYGKIFLAYCEDSPDCVENSVKYHVIIGDVSGKLEAG